MGRGRFEMPRREGRKSARIADQPASSRVAVHQSLHLADQFVRHEIKPPESSNSASLLTQSIVWTEAIVSQAAVGDSQA
jgi:hypothetical protein